MRAAEYFHLLWIIIQRESDKRIVMAAAEFEKRGIVMSPGVLNDGSAFGLAREIEEKLFLQPLSNLIAKITYDGRLERAWRRVERDYADPDLTLGEVASTSGANKNHLNVLFRQNTSLTFHQLLVRYRLARALEMMKSRNYSILEIALENGFGSMNTFERNFRVVLGTTPAVFRKQQDNWRTNQDFR